MDHSNYIKVNGLAGKLTLKEVIYCKLKIGELTINYFPWKSGDISDLVSDIKTHENIYIAGIIGSDLLIKFGINVNFESHILTYRIKDNIN